MFPQIDDSIFRKVKEVLVETLGADEGEVTLDAKMAEDLDCESLEYEDIMFRIKATFPALQQSYINGTAFAAMHDIVTVTDLCRFVLMFQTASQ